MKKLFFSLFFIICIVSLYAQTTTKCDSMLITKDTTIIIGDTITLEGRGMFKYNWSPSFANPNNNIQKVHPTQTTTYYLTGYYLDTNVVYNGNFDLGNTGFTSGYTYTTVRINEGYYAVGTNCYTFHASLPNIYDHTSGRGNYMIINGSPAQNKPVWSQTVPVHPNTDYVFITWVTSFCLPAADLQFSINGKQIGEIFHSPQKLGEWQQFYQIWNSGSSTQANITILNQNTVKQGNDFGLDDISFSAFLPCEDSVTVYVMMPIEAQNDTITVYAGETITIYPTLNDSINEHCGTVYPNILTPPTLGDISTHDDAITITVLPDITGTDSIVYSICCGGQCDTATIYIHISGQHDIFEDTICAGTPYHLHGFNLPPEQTITPGVLHLVDSAKNISGCDSITELYLQINSQPNIEVNYFGCDSLRWNNELIMESGDYTQTFSTAHGCDSIVLAHVIIKHDTISITLSEDFCLKEEAFLTSSTDLDNLQWSTGETNETIAINEPGKYWVSAGDSLCFASDTIEIKVCCPDSDYRLPNAITPSNGDGINDFFQLPDTFTPSIFDVKIYDRWGKLVFASTEPDFLWDGTVNGHIVQGVYYYAIKINRHCHYNGSITVL